MMKIIDVRKKNDYTHNWTKVHDRHEGEAFGLKKLAVITIITDCPYKTPGTR